MEETCEGCVFSHPIVDPETDWVSMRCHRFPPQVFVLENDVCQTFPEANHRCGEYKVAQ